MIEHYRTHNTTQSLGCRQPRSSAPRGRTWTRATAAIGEPEPEPEPEPEEPMMSPAAMEAEARERGRGNNEWNEQRIEGCNER